MAVMLAGQAVAETVFEDFSGDATQRWDYVADRVMGGVSSGRAEIIGNGSASALRLLGKVSTDNNGGFIQVRRRFSQVISENAEGVRLDVKGNGARYFVFLKTPKLSRVWHSYRAPFVTTGRWQTIDIPFDMFSPSHMGMPAMFAPNEVNSLAIVAYGDDYAADVTVREIRIY